MGEVQFNCPLCAQPLESDVGLVGFEIPCPGCGGEIRVPQLETPQGEPDPMSQEQTSADNKVLEANQQEIEAANRELARTKSVLIETLQHFRTAREEVERLRADAEAAEKCNASLRARIQAVEEKRGKIQVCLQSAEIQADDIRRQLEEAKSQRNVYLWETNRLQAALLQADLRIAGFEKERSELDDILTRSLQVTETLRAEGDTLKRELELRGNNLASALAELELSGKSREKSEAERERLADELLASRDADFLKKTQLRIEEVQGCMDKVNTENLQLLGKYEDAERERTALRKENLDLKLHLSAAREALCSSNLHQENELLRGVIERTNEQMRASVKMPAGVRFLPLNEPSQPEAKTPAGLRWLHGLFARWGHPV